MRIPLDEGIKFNEFLKDFSKKAKQPFDQVKKAMSNKSTYAVAKLNDFSVNKVWENSKKGYKAVANIIKYVPKKIAKKINNTTAGKKKDKYLMSDLMYTLKDINHTEQNKFLNAVGNQFLYDNNELDQFNLNDTTLRTLQFFMNILIT